MLQDLYCTFTALNPNCLHPDSSITGYLVTIRNDKALKRVSFYGSYEKCTSAANQLFTELFVAGVLLSRLWDNSNYYLLCLHLVEIWSKNKETERSRNINTTATENLKCFIKSSQGSEDKRDSAQNFSFQKCNQTTRIKEDISIFSST